MKRVKKQSILPEESDVTQKVLSDVDFSKSMEKDIEKVDDELDNRQIDFEEFEKFINNRLTTISSWNSRADTTAEKLVDGDVTFEDAFEIIQIPGGKDRTAISHGQSADLKQVLSNSQVLIGQLAVMLRICVDSLEYAEEAVDIQKSQKVQKETIKILRDNMGDIMANTAQETVRGVVVDAVDEVRNTERLKQKIADLEEKVDSENSIDKDEVIEEVKDEVTDEIEDSKDEIDLLDVIENTRVERYQEIAWSMYENLPMSQEQVSDVFARDQGGLFRDYNS